MSVTLSACLIALPLPLAYRCLFADRVCVCVSVYFCVRTHMPASVCLFDYSWHGIYDRDKWINKFRVRGKRKRQDDRRENERDMIPVVGERPVTERMMKRDLRVSAILFISIPFSPLMTAKASCPSASAGTLWHPKEGKWAKMERTIDEMECKCSPAVILLQCVSCTERRKKFSCLMLSVNVSVCGH